MLAARAEDYVPSSIPLNDIAALVDTRNIAISVDGDTLIARHEDFSSRMMVVAPKDAPRQWSNLTSVVRVVTTLPTGLQGMLIRPEFVQAANVYASLGALSVTEHGPRLESRLSIRKTDSDAWYTLYAPLLAHALMAPVRGLIGRMRRAFTTDSVAGGDAQWTGEDFALMQREVSSAAACTATDDGLTAEFGIYAERAGAMASRGDTATFTASTTETHPRFGSGLFCLLRLPHVIESKERLERVCARLNRLEMAALDLPPHFGAWTSGCSSNSPAYVSFFPRVMHGIPGIGSNAAFWAMRRARWAAAIMPSLGVTAAGLEA